MFAAVEGSLDVAAEVDNVCLVGGASEEGGVLYSFRVLLVVLVVPPADPAVLMLATRFRHELNHRCVTISSISMRDSATLLQ